MAVLPKADLYARAVSDRDEIAAYLRSDRVYAAYMFGDLDGPNRHRCTWGMAHDDLGRPIALVMHQEGLVPQPMFLMGDPAGCREILETVIKPRDAYFMGTDAIDAAERLTAADIEELNRLYQLGFRGGFPASIVEDGVYYGVRVRGHLVAAAGTHVINAREGIAVVGNVLTHVDYRGHDFAKMVTSAVTGELLGRVRDVTLNVHADNDPAVAAYRRLGYRDTDLLTERLGRRRHGGWGLMRPIREAIRLPWQRDPK
jgi:ribosomal protein S18 acetylase RimI-like enzyme